MKIKLNPKRIAKKKTPFVTPVEDERNVSQFLHTGCHLLNLALSGRARDGGWPCQRIVNVIGTTTTGKSLVCWESVAQLYHYWYKEGKKVTVKYNDTEQAFDPILAYQASAVPADWVEWGEAETVQDFFTELYKDMREYDNHDLYLHIVDSLDGLTELAEQERFEDRVEGKAPKGSYGAEKAKELKAGFRTVYHKVRHKNVLLIIISQVIDLIGARAYVRVKTRAGGNALDHYASVIVWLKETDKITKTVNRKEIPIGKRVEVKITKNRIYREGLTVPIVVLDRWGIDDIQTSIEWLAEYGYIHKEGQSYHIWGKKKTLPKWIKTLEGDKGKYEELIDLLQEAWDDFEKKIRMERRPKYV